MSIVIPFLFGGSVSVALGKYMYNYYYGVNEILRSNSDIDELNESMKIDETVTIINNNNSNNSVEVVEEVEEVEEDKEDEKDEEEQINETIMNPSVDNTIMQSQLDKTTIEFLVDEKIKESDTELDTPDEDLITKSISEPEIEDILESDLDKSNKELEHDIPKIIVDTYEELDKKLGNGNKRHRKRQKKKRNKKSKNA